LIKAIIFFLVFFNISLYAYKNIETPGVFINGLEIDDSGKLWASSYNGLFVIKNNKLIKTFKGPEYKLENNILKKSSEAELDTNIIISISIYDGKCYVGTDKALYIIDTKSLAIERVMQSKQVNSICKIGSRMLLGRNDGLFYIDKFNSLSKALNLKKDFSIFNGIPIKKILYDSEHRQIWFSLSNGGIKRFSSSGTKGFFNGMTIFTMGKYGNKDIVSSDGSLLLYNGYSWNKQKH